MSPEERRHGEPQEAPVVPPPPGSVADLFSQVLPNVEFVAAQGALDVIITISRDDVPRVLRTAKEDPRLASVTPIWKGADWHEREAAEMFGLVFEGHPNPVPLLLPEDMTDHHPLRKDSPLAEIEEWQGEALRADVGRAGYIPPGMDLGVQPEEVQE